MKSFAIGSSDPTKVLTAFQLVKISGQLSNISLNQWAGDITAAGTWLYPQHGIDLSAGMSLALCQIVILSHRPPPAAERLSIFSILPGCECERVCEAKSQFRDSHESLIAFAAYLFQNHLRSM